MWAASRVMISGKLTTGCGKKNNSKETNKQKQKQNKKSAKKTPVASIPKVSSSDVSHQDQVIDQTSYEESSERGRRIWEARTKQIVAIMQSGQRKKTKNKHGA